MKSVKQKRKVDAVNFLNGVEILGNNDGRVVRVSRTHIEYENSRWSFVDLIGPVVYQIREESEYLKNLASQIILLINVVEQLRGPNGMDLEYVARSYIGRRFGKQFFRARLALNNGYPWRNRYRGNPIKDVSLDCIEFEIGKLSIRYKMEDIAFQVESDQASLKNLWSQLVTVLYEISHYHKGLNFSDRKRSLFACSGE